MDNKLYCELARLVAAIRNCEKSNNQEWLGRHTARLKTLVQEEMPSGSGIDNGTKIDLDASTPDKLVFEVGFHHMNDGGMYDGWTEHRIIVTPSLAFGFDLRITGKDRNEIKEYLNDVYYSALNETVTKEQYANP